MNETRGNSRTKPMRGGLKGGEINSLKDSEKTNKNIIINIYPGDTLDLPIHIKIAFSHKLTIDKNALKNYLITQTKLYLDTLKILQKNK